MIGCQSLTSHLKGKEPEIYWEEHTMSKRIGSCYVFFFYVVFFFFNPHFVFAKNSAVSFSKETNQELIGENAELNATFSSVLKADSSVNVQITINQKQFTAYFVEDTARIECISINTGEPAKLLNEDVEFLKRLYLSLYRNLDKDIWVQNRLGRFIAYLINFHPINEYFDNEPLTEHEKEDQRATESILKSDAFQSICDEIGNTIQGVYVITRYYQEQGFDCGTNAQIISLENGHHICLEYGKVAYDEDPCLGRCGPGCSDKYPLNGEKQFTQECLNHDLCAGATGKWMGPCACEFDKAKAGYFNAPECNEPTGECGAYVAPGVWKEFDCYNLAAIGKTTNDDPFTQSWRLIGGYWQWGRKGPDSSQWYNTNTANFAHGPTGPESSEANSGAVSGWDTSDAPNGAWSDASKTANDPCPAGYRVPTQSQWDGVDENNTQSVVGTWSSSYTNYSTARFFGNDLMLPAAGYRYGGGGSLYSRGGNGSYWASTELAGYSAWTLSFTSGSAGTGSGDRRYGFSVRCVVE